MTREPDRSIVVNLEAWPDYDGARTGFWCDACSLPTGVEFDIVETLDGMVQSVHTEKFCVRCEGCEDEA